METGLGSHTDAAEQDASLQVSLVVCPVSCLDRNVVLLAVHGGQRSNWLVFVHSSIIDGMTVHFYCIIDQAHWPTPVQG